jgi:hypothetical protein
MMCGSDAPKVNAKLMIGNGTYTKKIGRCGCPFAVLVLAALVSRAQVQNPAQSVDTSQPIVVKSSKPPQPKPLRFLGEVLSSNTQSMTVRSRDNARMIRTFTYAQGLHDSMQQIDARGGYQYGDKVEVEYAPGSDIALRIKGKPSPPKHF